MPPKKDAKGGAAKGGAKKGASDDAEKGMQESNVPKKPLLWKSLIKIALLEEYKIKESDLNSFLLQVAKKRKEAPPLRLDTFCVKNRVKF